VTEIWSKRYCGLKWHKTGIIKSLEPLIIPFGSTPGSIVNSPLFSLSVKPVRKSLCRPVTDVVTIRYSLFQYSSLFLRRNHRLNDNDLKDAYTYYSRLSITSNRSAAARQDNEDVISNFCLRLRDMRKRGDYDDTTKIELLKDCVHLYFWKTRVEAAKEDELWLLAQIAWAFASQGHRKQPL
jgi:hypothetical protein